MSIIFRSFSTRLSLLIIAVTGVLFALSFVLYFYLAKKAIVTEVFQKSEYQLTNVTKSIDAILASAELSAANTAYHIEQNLDNPAAFKEIIANMLISNPDIYGSGLGFEPYFYPNEGEFFMSYTQYDNSLIDGLSFEIVGNETYDYHTMDWYLIPKLLEKSYWSEPYYDEGAGNILMTTYSQLIYDKNNKVVGVLGIDISLDWFSQMVLANKPYPNSYAFMLSRNAYYLAHRENNRILNETFFTATGDMADKQVKDIGEDMIAQKGGSKTFFNDDIRSYVFYEPIPRIGWSIATVSQESDVMKQFSQMSILVWITASASLILLFILSWLTIRKLATPLREFADTASVVAQGNFDTPIKEIKSRDEMYELRKSFVNMQMSLKNYINELKETTVARERIESELAIAHQIQMGMLPKVFPPFPNCEDIDLYALLEPAKEVGGDLYDFFVKNDKLYFTVGDASGKGVPASLLMAVTSSLFRSVASHTERPEQILELLNNSISENNDANMFITLFVGVLDLKTGVLDYANGGHNLPVIVSPTSGVHFLDSKANIALGIFDGMSFEAQQITLQRGESIFIYSDGLTEAENSAQELYSDQRLIDTLKSIVNTNNPQNVINIVKQSVDKFVNGNEQSDDLTMLIINYKTQS